MAKKTVCSGRTKRDEEEIYDPCTRYHYGGGGEGRIINLE